MCGICGIADFQRPHAVTREDIHRMNQTIRHRGPDDEGIFIAPGIGLGHRRLSIIDVSGGHQPLCNEDGTVWVLLNGEIYNYTELRQHLLAKGHRFATRSDTEAIVHLYEEHGEEAFTRLRGMFAIAIWDSRRRRLVLARDRVGKKPLFYSAREGRVLFGSELKCLLTASGTPREMDAQALSDYFSLGYVPAPKTIYRHIRKLLPGHYLVATADIMRETQYWDISFARIEHRSEEQWCEIVREELAEASRIRLMSEVPLGAFLSGGLDSSAVVAMMAKSSSTAVTTCSIGFEENEYDERRYARQVAHKFETRHSEEVVQPKALEIVDKLAWHFDEPFADASAVPTFYVSQAARRHVTVALGGDGGDESFAGYRRYYFDRLENRIRRFVPAALRRSVFGPLGRIYPGLAWAPRVFRGKATFQSLGRSPIEGYFNSVSLYRPDEKERVFHPDLLRTLGGYDSVEVFRHYHDRADTDDPLSRIQYVDIKVELTDDILAKVDRASMAVSLEVRAPLLDHKLMERVATMPSSLKLQGRTSKYIFKKAMSSALPHDVVYRSKRGFILPLAEWFRRDLREMAHDTIFSENDGLLNRAYLQQLWEQHQRKQYDRSRHLWAVLMFLKWKQAFQSGNVGQVVGAGVGQS